MTAGAFDGALSWLTNPNSQVSAHYIISKQGRVVKLVDELNTAWHAGRVDKPTWAKIKANVNPNFYTIGIEHENINGEPMTLEQWRASSALIADIAARWDIALSRDTLVRHHSIYSLKTCPGSGICLGF